jgi:hypothetical protein
MASIQPQNIAQQLSNTLAAQGFVNQYVIGSTIVGDNCASVSCEDGGDGTTFRAVFNTLDSVEKLSSIHSDGKVVQIKANNQVDPYYMVFKGTTAGTWGTGTWLEGPAQIVTPNAGFGVAGVSTDGTDFVVASTPAVLNACMDRNTYPAGNVSYGFSCPSFATSVCGDLTQSGAIPYFFQKRVSLMTVFQDRLVIVADGTVFMSRTGDYFNFFRRTMLSVQDDDPIEVYALGASDDVISRAVTYNKNLFMFGQRNQYVIPGSQIASPKTISVSTVASERDAMLSQPVTSGNLIFYGTQRQASDTTGPYSGIINQFQLGLFQDTPETYQISKQLSKYLSGRPLEMAAISSPPTLFVRTDGLDNGFYVYSYLDAPGSQERQFDSWGRWELYKDFGTLLSITSYQQKVIAFFLAPDAMAGAATKLRISALEFTMDTTDRSRPFLDCMHRLDQSGPIYTQWNNWQTSKMWPGARTAISAAYPEFLTASPMSQWGGFAAQYYGPIPASGFVVGFDYDSYATITSPYVRDSNDKAVVNGRLVINKYAVSLTETAGCRVTLTDVTGADKQIGDFNGRLVSRSNNLVGRVPVSTTVYSVPVGRANTEHRITFHSKPVLPMTISAIEWIGQLFTSGRRV